MLSEIQGESAANISRSAPYNNPNRRNRFDERQLPFRRKPPLNMNTASSKFCAICDTGHRKSDHFLSECPFFLVVANEGMVAQFLDKTEYFINQ